MTISVTRIAPVVVAGVLAALTARAEGAPAAPTLERQVLPLLKSRCAKCHGPAKREGELNVASPKGLARGGKHGAPVVPGKPDDSLIWTRVADDEMPPEDPLSDDEKALLRTWIESGASGLPAVDAAEPSAADHWSFARLRQPELPSVRDPNRARGRIDLFIQAALEAEGLSLGPEAERRTLVRRVAFDLTGLPPRPEEIAEFLNDGEPGAYERMVERYLSSPSYGERWGKYWLDAAGYADSNGYFNADTDRPLAWRYRDYVIRAWNADRPFDQFVREQIAGDELGPFRRGEAAPLETIDRLVATHFLRNSQDGTGESDGNPDELRADRYAVLEGTIEILGSSLFGLTFQCARCHDHKFEPVTQKDYYRLQAVLAGAFPVDKWAPPNDRVVEVPLPGEREAWEARGRQIDAEIADLKATLVRRVEEYREKGATLFRDDFDETGPQLAERWGPTAPGDDAPGGPSAVRVDSATGPAAQARKGTLAIIDGGGPGSRWLSTTRAFDWTPDEVGGWIQATFELVDRKVEPGGTPAERVGYYIALHDYQDNSAVAGGNILFDGKPDGGAVVHVDYPGSDDRVAGTLGKEGYQGGRRYGVRITNEGAGRFRLQHLVDWFPDGDPITLNAADLPDGGFGFELCNGRSFVVDRVMIEAGGGPGRESADRESAARLRVKRKEFDDAIGVRNARRGERPGRIAWVSDLSASPPPVHLLIRGGYNDRGPVVEPGTPSVLAEESNPFEVATPFPGSPTTGRRLALARWITKPGSRASALLARVTVNRVWQAHFGSGLVATPENLGYSGAAPTHPALLEELASSFESGGWSMKALHRQIVCSAVYRQSSAPNEPSRKFDPENRLLWRYPLRRLDSDAIRDAILAVAGRLDPRQGGTYVPAGRSGTGDVVVADDDSGFQRRSVYLQQRRSHVVGMLEVFDSPSIVTNCTRRAATTIPLQSLSLLNSAFVRGRAIALSARLAHDVGLGHDDRIGRLFMLAYGRPPSQKELDAAQWFLLVQPRNYPGDPDAQRHAWADLCQMVLASNEFLYLE